MTDSGSIWLRDLTQSTLTNKFHNTDSIHDAIDFELYQIVLKFKNNVEEEAKSEVSIEMFHNVYEKGMMVSEDRLVSELFK